MNNQSKPSVGENKQTGDLQNSVSGSTGNSSKDCQVEPGKSGLHRNWKAESLRWGLRAVRNILMGVAVASAVLAVIGISQKLGWIGSAGTSAGGDSESARRGGAQGERYICPMMCTPPAGQPGRCPVCGMELVPAVNTAGGDGISVMIEPAARRLIGIQTAISEVGQVDRQIRTIGSIDFDQSRLATIAAYFDGRIEDLYADYVGVPVKKGDDLAMLYSPKLYSAQTEFVASLESQQTGRFNAGSIDLAEIAQEKLQELGLSSEQIAELRQSRKPQSRLRIQSPQTGTVLEKAVVEGDYVRTGQTIYRIADLTTVWLMLDLYPDDAAFIRFGQPVEAEVRSIPGEVFVGRVAFVDPTVNPKTRTVQVRVEFLNIDGQLRPGDYAAASIRVPATAAQTIYDPALAGKFISPMHPQIIRDAPGSCPRCGMDLIPASTLGYAEEPIDIAPTVTVPRDAVLFMGQQGVVYVETDPGRFEIRRVSLGAKNDERVVVIDGLVAGETVATNGNFLIDSQMQLAGNPSLLDPSRAPAFPPGPLKLPAQNPVFLPDEAGTQLDRVFEAYFDIGSALAADQLPPPVLTNAMIDALHQLERQSIVPDKTELHLSKARRAAVQLSQSLEASRRAFRSLSHALLHVAAAVRGPHTAEPFAHFYCPMVPGGGGDWLQRSDKLANPYWGAEMLECGELVEMLPKKADSSDQSNSSGIPGERS